MAADRESRFGKSARLRINHKSPRGVGSRRERPDDFVPVPGSPSISELKRARRRTQGRGV